MESENKEILKTTVSAIVTGMVLAGLFYFLTQKDENQEEQEEVVENSEEEQEEEAQQIEENTQETNEENIQENDEENNQQTDDQVPNQEQQTVEQDEDEKIDDDDVQNDEDIQNQDIQVQDNQELQKENKDSNLIIIELPECDQKPINKELNLEQVKLQLLKEMSEQEGNQSDAQKEEKDGLDENIIDQLGAMDLTLQRKNSRVMVDLLENTNIFSLESFQRIHEEAINRTCEQYTNSINNCREKRRGVKDKKNVYGSAIAQMYQFNQQILQSQIFQICMENGFNYMDYQRSLNYYNMQGSSDKIKEMEKEIKILLMQSQYVKKEERISRSKVTEIQKAVVEYLREEAGLWLREIQCRNIDLVVSIIECLIQDFVKEKFNCEFEDVQHRVTRSRMLENEEFKKLSQEQEELIQKLLIPFRQQQFMVIYRYGQQ